MHLWCCYLWLTDFFWHVLFQHVGSRMELPMSKRIWKSREVLSPHICLPPVVLPTQPHLCSSCISWNSSPWSGGKGEGGALHWEPLVSLPRTGGVGMGRSCPIAHRRGRGRKDQSRSELLESFRSPGASREIGTGLLREREDDSCLLPPTAQISCSSPKVVKWGKPPMRRTFLRWY